MKRTQIYLEEETLEYLKNESKTTGKTVSQIIRECIDSRKSKKVSELLKRSRKAYGIWKDRDFDVDEYIRDLRKDREVW